MSKLAESAVRGAETGAALGQIHLTLTGTDGH